MFLTRTGHILKTEDVFLQRWERSEQDKYALLRKAVEKRNSRRQYGAKKAGAETMIGSSTVLSFLAANVWQAQ